MIVCFVMVFILIYNISIQTYYNKRVVLFKELSNWITDFFVGPCHGVALQILHYQSSI
jgi:hypothetical protein